MKTIITTTVTSIIICLTTFKMTKDIYTHKLDIFSDSIKNAYDSTLNEKNSQINALYEEKTMLEIKLWTNKNKIK